MEDVTPRWEIVAVGQAGSMIEGYDLKMDGVVVVKGVESRMCARMAMIELIKLEAANAIFKGKMSDG